MQNGRPLALEWAAAHIPTILVGWQLGTQTGNAIAQVLYGDYNPSAKLPMAFPRNVGQIPVYYNYKNTGRATNKEDNVFWSHYIDQENTPLYPFGHGLSYTNFEYSNLTVSSSGHITNPKVTISVSVSNTGNYDGKEVVQLYIRDVIGSLARPVKELKGFELVALKKGETKQVNFKLSKSELGYYNNKGDFVIEPGDFEIFIGGSSATELKGHFTLE